MGGNKGDTRKRPGNDKNDKPVRLASITARRCLMGKPNCLSSIIGNILLSVLGVIGGKIVCGSVKNYRRKFCTRLRKKMMAKPLDNLSSATCMSLMPSVGVFSTCLSLVPLSFGVGLGFRLTVCVYSGKVSEDHAWAG